MVELSKQEFTRLLQIRSALRRFIHWSEQQARDAGITPAQHQLLLAIRGHPEPIGPTVGDVARHLLLRHHSVVGLVDRASAAGLVERSPDLAKPGTVRLTLTEKGSRALDALASAHRDEIARFTHTLEALEPPESSESPPP